LSLPASDPTIMKAQEALVWSGYYDGPIDGNSGPGTQAAIRRFQHDIGKAENGALDDAQSAALLQRAQRPIQATGFRQFLDPQTGIRVGIPLAITEKERT
jgi:peptidoglycan hydrolase-like protein with peptidoglycan-binding domain